MRHSRIAPYACRKPSRPGSRPITAALLGVTLLTCSTPSPGRELVVSPTGSDTAAGTREEPLGTLGKAVTIAEPGDTCVLLPGVYRRKTVIDRSGEADRPIRIVAEGEVLLDGTDPVEGAWETYEGNILKIRLPGPAVEQAFLDGFPLSPARWPNATFRETWIRSTWAKGAKGSKKDLMVCPELAGTGVDWTGAVAVLNVGHQYKTWTREILSHGAGSERFTYELAERLGDGRDDGPGWWNDRFYLTGTLKALDAPGEFHHDAEAGWFYCVTKDGQPPKPGSIGVKRRDYAIQGRKVHDIQVSGFKVFGCTIRFDASERIVIETCDIRFPAFSAWIVETLPKDKRKGRSGTPVTSVTGVDNVIRGCTVAYTGGAGIEMAGHRNRVEDCIVHDVCWSGTIHFAGITIRDQGREDRVSASAVSRCTVYNAGNIGIQHRGKSNIVEHNTVHHTGLACHDIAAIHTGSPNTAGTVVRYNVVHHSMGKGIRGDDQTRELTVHHNLVYRCDEGIIVKGDRNRVYHNTVLGFDGHGVLIIPTRQEPKKWWTPHPILDVQNANSLFFNNYVGTVSYRHQPIPQNKGISHNVTYDKQTPFAEVLVRADRASLETGTVDARPRAGSLLVDAGRKAEGLTDGFAGEAPDVGAFEHGKPAWTAGARRPVPDDIVLKVEAEVARMWALPGTKKPEAGRIPLPGNLRNADLSDLAKKKLQDLYDTCWKPEEIRKRADAIRERGKHQKGTEGYDRQHAIVIACHRVAARRLVEKAATVLAGSELKQFYAIMGK